MIRFAIGALTLILSLPSNSLGSSKEAIAVRVTPIGVDAREPQATVGSDGTVWLAYGVGNAIYCTHSKDQPISFVERTKVGEAGILSLGMRRGHVLR